MSIDLGDVIGFAQKAAPLVQKAAGKLGKKKNGAAADYFLKLDGIDGESADSKQKGAIEVTSFELAASQAGSGGRGGGSGAGKVNFDDMTFVTQVNKAYPKLLLACATGQHIKEATLIARKAGGEQQEYLNIKFTDVLVSGIQLTDAGEGDPVPMNIVSLNFAEIDIDYKPQKSDGTLDSSVKAGFSLKTNKKK